MGKGADGGGTRRARRHTGSIAAAAVGATALATAAAVAGWQRRRRERAITPEDSLAGPPTAVEPPPRNAAAPERATPGPAVPERATPGPAVPLLPTITGGDPPMAPVTAVAPPPRDDVDRPPRAPDPAPDRDRRTAAVPDPGRAAVLPQATPTRRRTPRGATVGIGLVLVLVLAIAVLVLQGGDGDDAEAADPRPAGQADDPAPSTTTTTAPVTAVDAFAVASRALTEAGSFTYTGTADATDVSVARPMLWLAVATTVEGEVNTSTRRLREMSVAADGSATETIAAVSEVWGRRAPSADELGDVPLEPLPGLSGGEPSGRGAALVPWWLAAAVAPSDLGPDEQGRRTFQATIPAAAMGVIERDVEPVDAVVTLTLEDGDDPVRVEIVSAPDGPPFHLVFEIVGLGDPVVIETPADTEPTPTG